MLAFLFFLLFAFLIQIGHSIDARINFQSNYTFSQRILKAENVTSSGQEFLLILFEDGIIRKLTTLFEEVETFQINNTKIVDFKVSDQNKFAIQTPSIVCITQTRNQLVLVSMLNSIHRFSITRYSGLFFVSSLKLNIPNGTYFQFEGLIYYHDEVRFYRNLNGTQTQLRVWNFSLTGASDPTIRVFQSYYSNSYLYLSISQSNFLNVVSVDYDSVSNTYSVGYRPLANLSSISTQPVINIATDKDQLYIVQFQQNFLYTSHFDDWYPDSTFTQQLIDEIGSSVLIDIRPKYPTSGQRIYILNDRTIKVTLAWNGYSFVQDGVTYGSYNLTPNLRIVRFSSGINDFAYEINQSTIYSYAETLVVNGTCINTTLNVSFIPQTPTLTPTSTCDSVFSNCLTCDTNLTICTGCDINFTLFGNECFLIRTCAVSNCQICNSNQSCLKCTQGSVLDQVNNTCNIPLTQNITISNSTTTNQSSEQPQPVQPQANETISVAEDLYFYNQISQVFGSFKVHTQVIIKIFSVLNSSPILRTLLPFLSPLFFVFDDYWYYIYHKNSYENLQTIQNSLIFMYVVNEERIMPPFLRFYNPLQPSSYTKSNYSFYTESEILLIDQKHTFLIENLNDVIFQQYFICGSFFIVLKLFTLMVRKYCDPEKSNGSSKGSYDKKSVILSRLYHSLQEKISSRNVLNAFIGSNLIFFAFQLGLQFKTLFVFNAIDKINIIISLNLAFGLIAFCLYIFLKQKSTLQSSNADYSFRKPHKTSSSKHKPQKNQNFFLQYVIHVKCLGYGFVHGYFLQHNFLQYFLLISIKIILLINITSNQKEFKRRIHHYLTFVYFTVGIVFDALCLISKFNLIPSGLFSQVFSEFNWLRCIEILIVGSLCFSVTVFVFIEIFYEFKEIFFKFHYVKEKQAHANIFQVQPQPNKVAPEPQSILKDDIRSVRFKITRTKLRKVKKTKDLSGQKPVKLNQVMQNQTNQNTGLSMIRPNRELNQ